MKDDSGSDHQLHGLPTQEESPGAYSRDYAQGYAARVMEERRDRRDRYICAALTGLISGDDGQSTEYYANFAVWIADAVIAKADKQP